MLEITTQNNRCFIQCKFMTHDIIMILILALFIGTISHHESFLLLKTVALFQKKFKYITWIVVA